MGRIRRETHKLHGFQTPPGVHHIEGCCDQVHARLCEGLAVRQERRRQRRPGQRRARDHRLQKSDLTSSVKRQVHDFEVPTSRDFVKGHSYIMLDIYINSSIQKDVYLWKWKMQCLILLYIIGYFFIINITKYRIHIKISHWRNNFQYCIHIFNSNRM